MTIKTNGPTTELDSNGRTIGRKCKEIGKFGGSLEKIWRKFGGSLEEVWRKFGGSLEEIWRKFGEDLEEVWRKKEWMWEDVNRCRKM